MAGAYQYKVSFEEGTIGNLLGFTPGILSTGYNMSPNIVDIMPINTILVNIDIIQGSYINGNSSPAIYLPIYFILPSLQVTNIYKTPEFIFNLLPTFSPRYI